MQQEKETNQDIFLREMSVEDTDRIIDWRNSESVRRNFIYQKPFTRQGHTAWMQNMIGTGKAVQFMICLKGSGVPVGSVYLRDIDRVCRKAEFGIFIDPACLGKGYGTQAARLILEHAFDRLELHKVMLRVFARNISAQKCYEKAGFIQEAYLRDEVFLNGKYEDLILMASFNEADKKEEAE